MYDFVQENRIFDGERIPIDSYFVSVNLQLDEETENSVVLNNPSECFAFAMQAPVKLIYGPSGCGKTHFLKAVMQQGLNSKDVIPIYVDLSKVANIDEMSQEIVDAIHKFKTLFPLYTYKKSYLFLFDNFEGAFKNNQFTLKSVCDVLANFSEQKCLFASTFIDDCQKEFVQKYKISPLAHNKTYTLWNKLDSIFKAEVTRFLNSFVEDNQQIFADYLKNPFLATVLYRASAFFSAVQGTKYDAFRPEPNRNKFFKIRYAMEQIIYSEFKQQTKLAHCEVVSNGYKSFRELPILKSTRNDFVIEPHSNGIGDLLWFSHLPRIAKEFGKFEKVLVVKNRCQNSLIWDHNPYVDGYCLEENCRFKVSGREIEEVIKSLSLIGDNKEIKVGNKTYGSKEINLLDWIMLKMNFDDQVRFHKPELYYKPTIVPFVQNKIIYDPYWWSNPRVETKNLSLVDQYFERNELQVDYQMKFIDDVQMRNNKYTMIPIRSFRSFLSSLSIFDFCDVLASAKHVFCLTTGTSHLTDALNTNTTVLMDEVPSGVHHSLNHHYCNLMNLSN